MKIKKIYYVLIGVLLLLIITNPSIREFKDHVGYNSTDNVFCENNFLIFSIYKKNNGVYYGVLSNFIKVKNEDKPFIPVKYSLLEIYQMLRKAGWGEINIGTFQTFANNIKNKDYGYMDYQLLIHAGYHDIGTQNDFIKTFCKN